MWLTLSLVGTIVLSVSVGATLAYLRIDMFTAIGAGALVGAAFSTLCVYRLRNVLRRVGIIP